MTGLVLLWVGIVLKSFLIAVFSPSLPSPDQIDINTLPMILFVAIQAYTYVYSIYYLVKGTFPVEVFTKVLMGIMSIFEVAVFLFMVFIESDSGDEYFGLVVIILLIAFLPDLINSAGLYLIMIEITQASVP